MQAAFSLTHALAPLELKGLGDHADGKRARFAPDPRDHRSEPAPAPPPPPPLPPPSPCPTQQDFAALNNSGSFFYTLSQKNSLPQAVTRERNHPRRPYPAIPLLCPRPAPACSSSPAAVVYIGFINSSGIPARLMGRPRRTGKLKIRSASSCAPSSSEVPPTSTTPEARLSATPDR